MALNLPGGSAPQIESKIPGKRLALLFTIMLVTAAGNTAMQSVMPAIGTKLGIADYWVSLAYSWSALLWVITAPRWARLSDQRGRKALMRIGMWGFISSFGFCALILWFGLNGWMAAGTTMLVFALFRSLYGMFGSAAPPAVQAYVAARTARTDRTKALSLIASSFGLGTVIGPALAPLIIVPGLGLLSPFVFFAGFGLAVVFALRFSLPDDDPRFVARGQVVAEPVGSGSGSSSFEEDEVAIGSPGADAQPDATDAARLAWLDPRLRPWLITGLVGGHAQAIILGIVGFLVLDRLGLRATPEIGAGPIGTVLMAGAFATLLAQWGLIPLLHMGPRISVLWGVTLGATGCTIVFFARDLHAIALGYALASLGFGLFRPGFTAGASLAVTRAEQGQVAGMVASVNGAAFIFAPALGVFVYGLNEPVAFGAIIALCLFVLIWGMRALQLDHELEGERPL